MSTSQPLLIELFTEELPPKALRKLGEAFGQALFESLKSDDFLTDESQLTTFATPRRLARTCRLESFEVPAFRSRRD